VPSRDVVYNKFILRAHLFLSNPHALISDMTPEYKAEKEASVSFLGGGGIWEINYVTLVAPVCSRSPCVCHHTLTPAGCRAAVVHSTTPAKVLQAVHHPRRRHRFPAQLLCHPIFNHRIYRSASSPEWFAAASYHCNHPPIFHNFGSLCKASSKGPSKRQAYRIQG
jgi:hypothetical protein